jgi:ATP-dependent DNA helicase RecQ
VTERGRAILKGEERLELRKESLKPRARGGSRREAAETPADVDKGLLSALKKLRLELAREQSVPAYVVFPDRTLIDMARLRPRNLNQMGQVSGVGEAKLDRYGDTFLEAIAAYEEAADL